MQLTFAQQVILAVVGGVVASVLTSILNNWWTDRRLRDQWEREKEERLEQWRREQDARRREWKREYRKELLQPLLEEVDKTAAVAGLFTTLTTGGLPSDVLPSEVRAKMPTLIGDSIMKLYEHVWSTWVTATDDETFLQLHREFKELLLTYSEPLARFLEAEEDEGAAEDALNHYYKILAAAHKLHRRAEELLEETFD